MSDLAYSSYSIRFKLLALLFFANEGEGGREGRRIDKEGKERGGGGSEKE